MAYYKLKGSGEASEKRIPRLMQVVAIEGSPIGNLQAAIDELSYLTLEYQKIIKMLEDKYATVSDESKRRVLRDAIFVLNSACREFSELRQKILRDLENGTIRTGMILEEVAVIKAEFIEINKALLELIEMRWWTW